jgi:DNA-binding CsgD family transcriptional regulator
MPHNQLVRLIYEACNDPKLWGRFLTRFAGTVRSDMAGLLTQDKAGSWARIQAAVGIDGESRKSYEQYFVSRNPWLARRNICPGAVETEEQILNLRELVRTEFYRDFLEPHSWLHGCSAVTNVEAATFSGLYALRTPRNGRFGCDEIELCRYLAPHIQIAARIQQRIADLEITVERLRAGEMDAKTLSSLDLTPAETRLAIALFKGQSVEGYAKESGISINTARWHVKQIYAKTGVKRQSELIQRLLKQHCRSAA